MTSPKEKLTKALDEAIKAIREARNAMEDAFPGSTAEENATSHFVCAIGDMQTIKERIESKEV